MATCLVFKSWREVAFKSEPMGKVKNKKTKEDIKIYKNERTRN